MSSKKTRNVTFNEISTKGTYNVKVVKPRETEDLKANDSNAIEEHNREVEVIRAEIAKNRDEEITLKSTKQPESHVDKDPNSASNI